MAGLRQRTIWSERCLGDAQTIAWAPDQLIAARAAAASALDGIVDVPDIAAARSADLAWAIAEAALVASHDASATLERAFAEADRIAEETPRELALLRGVLELRELGDLAGSARWASALRQDRARHEVVANDVRLLAEAGNVDGARGALASLPAYWTLQTDAEYWHGYPRWLGSAAMAACVALSHARVVSSPAASELVDDAERATAAVDEEWRQNREYRAIAFAWARLGQLDRALATTALMPGSERAAAIVALLDRFGDGPEVDVAQLEQLARDAIAGHRAVIVVDDEVTQLRGSVPEASEVAQARAFVDQVVLGDVVAALVRRHLARGDLAAARTAIDSIPPDLSSHHEARLQLEAARLRRGEATLDEVVAALPANELLVANLARAAAAIGDVALMHAVLRSGRHPQRIAANETRRAIQQLRLEDAAALLSSSWSLLGTYDRADLHAALVDAHVTIGRIGEALQVWSSAAPHDDPTPEHIALAAGLRLVVALVAIGETGKAQVLRSAIEQRLARF